MWNRLHALMIKELLSIWRDKKSRFVLIVPPLIQLFVFALAATLDVTNAPIAIFNEDSGKASFELIQRFKAAPVFHNLSFLQSQQEITKAIDNQQVVMVLHFDAQFSRDLLAGKEGKIQVILDGRKSNTTQIVLGYASTLVQQFNLDFAKTQAQAALPAELITRNWFNPNLYYYWFNIPNLCGILTTVIAFIVTALSLAREKELGTFDQLLVSPISPFEILLGKTLPALLVSLVEASIIIVAGIFIFRVPFVGNILSLYLSLIVFVASIVGIGLFVSALSKTQQQAILGSFLFLSPALSLSGYASPVENMPDWLQTLNCINPLRYFLIIVKGVFLKNMSVRDVLSYTYPIAIIALFTYSGAYLFFRRRLE